ncbi:late control protein D [Corallococcus sp. H22C18031201]|uniref:phage late control D family protein n=1 Tax=Citreicoccus inhibens TaxID=2849499 RepID=UPI000E73C039|nr:contractile injection system protein, VgrG/Pvc8 family [Citreicoccus inhibens]MBU8901067.1 phage late control D family protein [Citreicoccus inhibens]RJS14152.1 late control protein D [Corallococcus sp. H22C18031201]
MTRPLDRSAPGVRLTLLAHERARSGEPLSLEGRILGLTFEDSATKADKLSLQLDNFDLALFDRAELVGGAVLEVSWGYPGLMAPTRRMVVTKLKGFQLLTIEGQALSALMHREAKTRAWKGKTCAQVVREVAAEYGYEEDSARVEDTGESFDTIHQAGETDARFLRRLAAREEFEFTVDDRGLAFGPRNQATAPTHVLWWYADAGRGDVLSVNVESELGRRVGKVDVRGRDAMAKRNLEAQASSATVERTTLADFLEVVDKRTGTTSLQLRNSTTSVQPTSASTPAQAQRESEARFRRAEAGTVKLSLQVVGNPSLRAKSVVEVRGISSFLSGRYYVTEAKHVLSSSGYTTDLKLSRDGTGLRQQASAETQGQPQGGQSNVCMPATGGVLTELEVVDKQSGTTHVEYRGNGQSIGAGDPESGLSSPE